MRKPAYADKRRCRTVYELPMSHAASAPQGICPRTAVQNCGNSGVALAGVLGRSAANTASAAAAPCVNCDDTQMHDLARRLGASASAHIVWDPATGNVRRYRNYCGSAPNGTGSGPAKSPSTTQAGCRLQTEEWQADAELAAVATAMSTVWQQTAGTFKADFTPNVGGIAYPSYLPGKPTAHDFPMDASLRGELLDRANTPEIFSTPGTGSSAPLGNALTAIAAQVDAYLAMKQGVYLTIAVEFHGGSKISVKLTLGEAPQYVANTARDGSGHALPDPTSVQQGYSGRWYFGPEDGHNMAEFIESMRSLGVTITSGSRVPNGQVNCVWTPSNNTATCFIPR